MPVNGGEERRGNELQRGREAAAEKTLACPSSDVCIIIGLVSMRKKTGE